jgi:predicted nucleic acid binding AN1-type Zn finger protein
METCDSCGESTEHAFECNYCEGRFCGSHRLPENHGCLEYRTQDSVSTFGGDGPSTRDRRGTGRKRRDRVRANETARETVPESRMPRNKGDFRSSDERNTEVLTCPTCDRQTGELSECTECGTTVCPECEPVYEHECPVGIVKDDEGHENKSLLSRLVGFFR